MPPQTSPLKKSKHAPASRPYARNWLIPLTEKAVAIAMLKGCSGIKPSTVLTRFYSQCNFAICSDVEKQGNKIDTCSFILFGAFLLRYVSILIECTGLWHGMGYGILCWNSLWISKMKFIYDYQRYVNAIAWPVSSALCPIKMNQSDNVCHFWNLKCLLFFDDTSQNYGCALLLLFFIFFLFNLWHFQVPYSGE